MSGDYDRFRTGEEEIESAKETTTEKKNLKLKDRKVSWAKLRRLDSLNLEAGRVSMNANNPSKMGWRTTLGLAFQSIGIVYGDIGTSPLYVYASTFTDKIENNDDILGVLSLIIYTIVLIPMLKYVFVVLWANDNGNGGAFALYSLICRHVKVSLIPNQQPEDMNISNYALETPSSQLKRAQKVKQRLENSYFTKILLLLLAIMGTAMVIGDGILTPAISVLSAVSGISDSLGQNAVVGITIAILIVLFSVQRFGTDKVGITFAPIVLTWFFFIGGIGLYNLFKHDIGVLRAFNPKYIYDYFQRNGKKGWISLGGVFLCITGSEAMFADLGHFNVRAIQISFSFITCPALLAAYSGQAAFLRKYPEKVANTFYDSIPHSLYWPTFVVAVGAAIIASQAMISGAFSIISQALSLGCFPKVKVVHTSAKHHGQVYIPEINYMFMIACILICAAFKTTDKISHAYGIAVVGDMTTPTRFNFSVDHFPFSSTTTTMTGPNPDMNSKMPSYFNLPALDVSVAFPQATPASTFPPCASDYFQFDDLLTPEEQAVRMKVRKCMEKEIAPIMTQYWEKANFPFHVIPKFAELHIAGGTIKGYGCPGLSMLGSAVAAAEIARVDASFSVFILVHSCLAMLTIALCGSEAQKQKYLPSLAELKTISCWALTEPDYGSDASSLKTTATKVEGGWILEGQKRWIGNSTFADLLVIFARNTTTNQINGYIVKKDAPGLTATKIENKIGLRIVQNGDIVLKKLFVPDEDRIAELNSFQDTNKVLAASRVMVCWQPIGVSMGIYDMCHRYLKERKQFGAPLAAFQINQQKLVQMLGNVQAMVLVGWRLCKLYESGKLTPGHASLGKSWISLRARETAALGRELLGGNGILADYLVAKAFCDLEPIYTFEGTYDINTLVTGREVTGFASFKPAAQRSRM